MPSLMIIKPDASVEFGWEILHENIVINFEYSRP